MTTGCPLCGWLGTGRDAEGMCIDRAECAHRELLEEQGRPRDSACKCRVWPCSCPCHHRRNIHDPC